METTMQVQKAVNAPVDLPSLLRSLIYVEKVITLAELEYDTKIPTSTISNKLNGQTGFTAMQYIAIARSCARRGVFRPIEVLLPEGYSIAPVSCTTGVNGSLDDELGDFTELAGQARTEFEQGNHEAVLRVIPRMRPILNRMEKEARR